MTALHIVPPCEDDEPDPQPEPPEITAVYALCDALRAAEPRLGEALAAMQLSHDSGDPTTPKQRAAVTKTCHELRRVIAQTLYTCDQNGHTA